MQAMDDLQRSTAEHLYASLLPTVIMTTGFAAATLLMARTVDRAIDWLFLLAAVVLGVARIVVLLVARKRVRQASDIGTVQRVFAGIYILFAAALGAFAANVLVAGPRDAHLLVICLTVGYSAGAALLTGMWPQVASVSMIVAVVPSALALAMSPSPFLRLTAVMLVLLLAGGIVSLLRHTRTVKSEISGRLTSQMLAARDPLTGLWNRRALNDWYTAAERSNPGAPMAFYALDLDRFKAVNDSLGHQRGDDLLCAVAERLRAEVRANDIVVRLGGDEFLIVQPGLDLIDEAELVAGRIERALSKPVLLGQSEVTPGASIGVAIGVAGALSLNEYIEQADARLYARKMLRSAS